VNTTNKPYTGTVFVGGFGRQRDPATGAIINPVSRSLVGMIDGQNYFFKLPTLHVGSNQIAQLSTATAATLIGETDQDRWFPTRAGVLKDDLLTGFNYDTQKSPYGWTQRLDAGGHRIFVGGGIIPFTPGIEAVTLPGDSGSAVFLNTKAFVESLLWHTSYDDMLALGGVPDDALLSFLKPLYQNDTNYIVGVTSQLWVPGFAGCGSDANCMVNHAAAADGGGRYAMVLPHLAWIQGVLSGNGAGSIQTAALDGVDAGATYAAFAMESVTLQPEIVDPDPHPAVADLTVTTLSAPPASISPGSVYVVTDTTKNLGYVAAGPSTTRYYLSLDAVRNAGDKLMTGTRTVGGLDPAGESFGAAGVTIPTSTNVGSYYVLACADDKKVVTEISDADNCLASGGTIQIALADLVENTVSDPTASVTPGGKFTITDAAHNPSGVDSVASTTRYYLSLDAAKDAGDVLLSGARSVPALAAGASSVGDRQVTVPAATALNTYRLLACADDAAKVAESNEGNNCAAAAGSVVVGVPDLRTTLVNGLPPTVQRGKKIAPADTVLNQGTAPSGTSSTHYYLSVDTDWSAGDVLLTGTRSLPILAPNQTSGGSKTVTVPLTTAVGPYFVLACADDAHKIAEGNEANNCVASASTIAITH
jgi:hypothetical protein